MLLFAAMAIGFSIAGWRLKEPFTWRRAYFLYLEGFVGFTLGGHLLMLVPMEGLPTEMVFHAYWMPIPTVVTFYLASKHKGIHE